MKKYRHNLLFSVLEWSVFILNTAGDDFLGGESASRTVEMEDEHIIRQRLYDTLTRTERLYMLMKAEQGMSLDEMVQETGGTRASVKVALSKAKKKLEEQFKKMGYGK